MLGKLRGGSRESERFILSAVLPGCHEQTFDNGLILSRLRAMRILA